MADSVNILPNLTQSSDSKLILLQSLVEAEAMSEIAAFLDEQSEYEIANLLESFPADGRHLIWDLVPLALKGEVLAEVEDDIRPGLMIDMPASEIEVITQELDSQDIAEILDTVDANVRHRVIATLDAETRQQVNRLHNYEEWQVGSYMDPETVQVRADMMLASVQDWLRQEDLLDDQAQELLVVNDDNQLIGLLSLVDLIKSDQNKQVADFTDNAVTVTDMLEIQEAAAIFRSEDIRFAPVVDSQGALVGQLNVEDIMEIIQDDADSTLKHLSGVSDEEELFAPIIRSAKSRSIWLGINLLTALLAAVVIGQFEAVLSEVVALAVLMPVVASMGGIAGSQTLTVIIRGLAMGQIGGSNRAWLFNKELWVGMLNGVVWAMIMAVIAQLWFGNPMITLVIGVAIAINMTAANVAGIAIPLLLKQLNIDPALSASVILTTVTDIIGFLSFLGLATLLLLH